MALSLNVLSTNGKTYSLNGESLGYRKNIEKDPVVWEKLLPVLEESLQKELCYGVMDSAVDDTDDVEDNADDDV